MKGGTGYGRWIHPDDLARINHDLPGEAGWAMTAPPPRDVSRKCGFIERLRPDRTMTQHTRPRGDYWRTGRCEGTGAAPVAGPSPRLDAQDAAARGDRSGDARGDGSDGR